MSYPAKITHKLYVQNMSIILRNKMCNVYFWATRILKCAVLNFGAHGFNVQRVSPKIKHCSYMYIFWVFFCCSQLYKNVMIKSNGNLLSRPPALLYLVVLSDVGLCDQKQPVGEMNLKLTRRSRCFATH